MNARTRANISDYSVSVNTQDVFVLPQTFGRNYLSLQNVGPGTCAVTFNGSAASPNANGNIMLAANAKPLIFQKNVPQSAIHAKSGTTAVLSLQSDDTIPTGTPFWILNPGNPPSFDLDFINQRYWVNNVLVNGSADQFITTSRASGGTDLTPLSGSGQTITTFGNNVVRLSSKSIGLISEPSRINNLLNSTVPNTQTTASLGTGTYTLWVNGSGSAQASVGTATAPSLPLTATQGNPISFAITVAGTIVVTVAGSLNAFQLELGDYPTSLIVTGGATATRQADIYSLTTTVGSAYSVYSQGTPFAPTAEATAQVIAVLNDGSASNRFRLFRQSAGGTAVIDISSGGVGQVGPAAFGAWAQNTSGKLAASLTTNLSADSFNGGTAHTAVTATLPVNINELQIGSQGNLQWGGCVERVALWPNSNLSGATLAAITT